MVAGHDEQRRPERSQKPRRGFVLLAPPSVRDVAARDDEDWVDPFDELRDCDAHFRLKQASPGAEVQVGEMKDALRQARRRLQWV